MRWRRLFEDLEAQLDSADSAELAAEVADRTRREAALLRIVDRLGAARSRPVALLVLGAGTVAGTLTDVAPAWLLVEESAGHEVLIPVASVLAVSGLGPRALPPGGEGEVVRRLGIGAALRGLARSRTSVSLVLRDGSRLVGTIDRVGADHLELAEHPLGEPRRPGVVVGVRLVAFDALGVVRQVR